jgi:hypothetical protein
MNELLTGRKSSRSRPLGLSDDIGIKSSPSFSSLPPAGFNEQFSALTGDILISTGSDGGGAAGLGTDVFVAACLLNVGVVVGCGMQHSDRDVSAFRDTKFRLRERDLVCGEFSRFRAGSDGL